MPNGFCDNMGGVKLVCVSLVVLVNLQLISCKPIFGSRMWCDFFCDDDDDTSASTSIEDLLDALFDPCTDCPKRPSTTVMPINIMIPPNPTGMNLTLTPNGPLWNMNFVPWNFMGQNPWVTGPPSVPPGVPPGVSPGFPTGPPPGVPPGGPPGISPGIPPFVTPVTQAPPSVSPPPPSVSLPPPSVLPIATTGAPAAATTAAGSSAAPAATTAAPATTAAAG